MTYDRDRDVDVYERDDTYVEREGTGIGTILGIILAVVVVLAIVWFFFLGGMNNGTTAPDQNLDNNVNIEQPVNPGQQPPVEGEQPPADGEQPLY
jgi:hypothetical protein